MGLIMHSNFPYCPRAEDDCVLAPRRLAAVCHELGQHLHAFGLHAAALDQSIIPTEALEPLVQMNRSVQALEMTIKTLHELVNLAIKNQTPVLQPIPVRQLFDQLDRLFLQSGIAISFRNYRPQVISDPGILFRLLRCALRSAIRHSGTATCALIATTRKTKVTFSIIAPQREGFDRYRRSTNDLDLEIGQILSHQIGHAFDSSYAVDGTLHIAIRAPRAL